MTGAWRGSRRVLDAVWHHPLNADGRLAALLRVLRWQLRARCGLGPATVPFVGGTRLYVQRGAHAASGNWYCGLLEAGEMAFTLHLLRAEDLFVDVGANVGSYSLLAAGAVGAHVIAIEPVPETLAALRRHLALNGLQGRVRVVAAGAGARAGCARFTTTLGSVNRLVSTSESEPAGTVEAEIVTLDGLLSAGAGAQTPCLVKIDVEGQELAALQGAAVLLAQPGLRALIVETDAARAAGAEDNRELRARLAGHGFEPCRYEPRSRALAPADTSGANTLFVRDREWVETRLRTAPRFRLVNGWV